jgi:TPR repeat protein
MYKILLTLFIFIGFSQQIFAENEEKTTQEIQNLAVAGDTQSQFKLANMYYSGEKIEKDDKLSFYWYKQVAQKGYANAEFNVANSYYTGTGVEKNIDNAIYWYKKATEQNLVPAIYNLAYILENNKKNHQEAFIWYKKAAELNHGTSQLILANMYQNGLGVEKDNIEAKKWFEEAIKNNVENAEYGFAEFLETNGDKTKAVDLYKEASTNDSVLANYKLANIYLKDKNKKHLAMDLFKKAAEKEHHPAQQKLASLYNAKKDYKKAAFWYKKSADNGNIEAQYSLGVLYLKGLGVEKDLDKATLLFIQAASEGNTKAQYSLAIRYLKGDGIEKNYYEAAKWLTRAAEKGHSNAAYSLSIRYKLGQGVEKSQAKRIFWLEKAAKNGNPTAKYELSSLTLFGEKTGLEKNIAIDNLNELTANKDLSDRANYNLGREYLKSKPELAKGYLLKASKNNYQPAINLLKQIDDKSKKNESVIKNVVTPINAKNEIKVKKIISNTPIQKIEKNVNQINAEQAYRLATFQLGSAKNQMNFIEAFNTMLQAAKMGFPPAQSELAMMYLSGMGVKSDLIKARYFAELAIKNGYLPATQVLIHIKNAENKSF